MEHWSSRTGFILAAIGSAVGIGNIWRFSSVVGQNGGGAYLIPYIAACFLVAAPLMILEITVGRYYLADVVTCFRKIDERFKIAGWLVVGIVFLVLSYYLVITGWTLGFVMLSVAHTGENFGDFISGANPVYLFLACAVIAGVVVAGGVRKGIERVSILLVPFIFIILAGLLVYSASLPGFGQGLTYFLSPDFSVLSNPLLWSAAFGQAFFSLSVGQGILITYGAYLSRSVDVARSSIIIVLADLCVSLMAGITIFSLVFTFGLEPGMGATLAFSTIPKAFASIPFGNILSFGFFVLLFFAALTSAISMLEVSVAAFTRSFGLSRVRAAGLLVTMLVIVGLPSAASYSSLGFSLNGIRFLDFMDETVGTLGIPVAAMITSIAFSWFMDRKVLEGELMTYRGLRRIIIPACRYVIPVVLAGSIGARLVLNRDYPALHVIPGAPFPGNLIQGAGTFLILGGILLVIFISCRLFGCSWVRKLPFFGEKKAP